MGFVSNVVKNVKAREYVILILVGITFETIVVLIANRSSLPEMFDPWTLAALGLASYRAGRAVAFNKIFEWLRAPFTKTVKDSSGAGESTESTGTGVRKVIGELLCCPICGATWAALVMFGLLVLSRPVGMTLIYVLAAAGIAEYLHWTSERAEWQGRAAREESGSAWLLKNRGVFIPKNGHVAEQRESQDQPAWQVYYPDESEYSSRDR